MARKTEQPTLTDRVDAVEFRLHRQRIMQLVFYAIVLGSVIVVGVVTSRTHGALCTFRGDLQTRVANTQDYLARHEAKTIFGVPRATIVTNLNNQERSLESLNGLYC